ncbi:hypothetical protein [Kitasatospora sp. NPDC057015]|uniref:hypothetical protein n=1 Tax=Kitasatospora sp. NPDC057015 TaxID=3346001 RepID=UPI003634463C
MDTHRRALSLYAERICFPEPTFFIDNGCRSRNPRPALERLVGLVETGDYQVVLIPGPFVFSLDDSQASSVARQFDEAGCLLLELPPRRLVMSAVPFGQAPQGLSGSTAPDVPMPSRAGTTPAASR